MNPANPNVAASVRARLLNVEHCRGVGDDAERARTASLRALEALFLVERA